MCSGVYDLGEVRRTLRWERKAISSSRCQHQYLVVAVERCLGLSTAKVAEEDFGPELVTLPQSLFLKGDSSHTPEKLPKSLGIFLGKFDELNSDAEARPTVDDFAVHP